MDEMKRRNIDNLIGKKLPNSLLTPLGYAGTDSRRYALVRCRCKCRRGRVTTHRLCDVLSGHTISCGCVKHKRYVEHVRKEVSRLSPATIKQCFLSVVDPNASKPNLSKDVRAAAYYRRAERLKSLPDRVMLDIRLRALAHDNYAAIAKDNHLHPAEVAWIYKHIIKPEIEVLRKAGIEEPRDDDDIETSNHLKDLALCSIASAKAELEEEKRKRNRFWAHELRTPSSNPYHPKDDLGWPFVWMMDSAPFLKLNSKERNLLNWFRLTAARTFRERRDKRRRMARRQLEKRCDDIEAAA
jgi:hypothetical protein